MLKHPPYQNWWWRRRVMAGGGVVATNPADAPDEIYLHNYDYSDEARTELLSGTHIVKVFAEKTVGAGLDNYLGIAGFDSPLVTGTINSLRAGNFDATPRWNAEAGAFKASLKFMYPDMTWFVVLQPRTDATPSGFVLSDYGVGGTQLIYLKVGDGVKIDASVFMRDTGGDTVTVSSGGSVLTLNQTHLLVARFNGTTKTVHLWIDGVEKAFTNTNASYDPTTTWEGTHQIQTIGMLAGGSQGFQGYIGQIFSTKVALSNEAINPYARYLATKWGTTWGDLA